MGTLTTIEIDITTHDGISITKKVPIQPEEVDLVWQGESYTPPFYNGKALYAYQGSVVVNAIPQIIQNKKLLDPRSLIYTWSQDDTPIQGASGYGKDSVMVTAGLIPEPIVVTVVVSSFDGQAVAKRSVSLTPQGPEIQVYEDNPLYGPLYNNALSSSIQLSGTQLKLKAAPYYMASSHLHSTKTMAFMWNMNGTNLTDQQTDSLSLLKPANASGSTFVGISISDPSRIFEATNKSLAIAFGN